GRVDDREHDLVGDDRRRLARDWDREAARRDAVERAEERVLVRLVEKVDLPRERRRRQDPVSGSVAEPEKKIKSPHAYVVRETGESMRGTGGRSFAWIWR